MDRDQTIRTILAIALAVLVMVAWTMLFPQRPPAPQPAPAETPATAQQSAPPAAEPEPGGAGAATPQAGAAPAPAPAAAVAGQAGEPPFEVRTPHVEIEFSARGARVISWKLLGYPSHPQEKKSAPVDLVSTESRALDRHALQLDLGDAELSKRAGEAWFRHEVGPASAADRSARSLPDGTQRVDFRWSDGAGLEVAKTFWIPADSGYLAQVEWSATRNGQPLPGAMLQWGPGIGAIPEAGSKNQYAYRGPVVVALPGGIERLQPAKQSGDISWSAMEAPRWLALDEQYFAVAMIPRQPAPAVARVVNVPQASKGEEKQFTIGTAATSVAIFAGPKAGRVLAEVDQKLGTSISQMVNWGFFGFLAHPLYSALAWLERGVRNWGLAIILITVVIKLIFFPLTQRSMVRMRQTQQRMAALQPKIHKLKEKYRDKRDMESRRQMNEEMMALYKREGVNPAASMVGCLPLLLQLPVLYAMYTVLTTSIELRGAPFFGWIQDLSAADPYYITPIVMGLTMLLQQVMSMTKTEDPQQRAQQRMMLMMPVMFTWFFLWMPVGLVIYWLVNNILSIAQQWLINRQALAAPVAEPGRAR
ncbi:MAG: membrane protein insertase YidC [Acidobacteria bacterium]|nr:membrane protein insertase YidC [Acidobacteriota bacterium]